jgi:hypothetical protein
MSDTTTIFDEAPVQDQDLLLRLNQYFDVLDQRLRHGQGWFIFNAAGPRLNRISRFIDAKLAEDHASINAYQCPWRDFAINAYVHEVGLTEIGPDENGSFANDQQRKEFEIATYISTDANDRLRYSDMLVLIGIKPTAWHEASFLDRMLDARYRSKLATILVTADMPHKLQAGFNEIDPSGTTWSRVFGRMYETSLVAL